MKRTILIIEDNDLNRLLLRDLLTHHGYEVLEAVNGQAGVELARQCQPSLVLMDIQMPGMDGITATRLLKVHSGTCRLPVIALTSFAMAGDREKMLLAGFDDYVSKPIDTRQLPLLLKKHLGDDDGEDGMDR